jgi:hypothetical protein
MGRCGSARRHVFQSSKTDGNLEFTRLGQSCNSYRLTLSGARWITALTELEASQRLIVVGG